jgi:hypothetical protein
MGVMPSEEEMEHGQHGPWREVVSVAPLGLYVTRARRDLAVW